MTRLTLSLATTPGISSSIPGVRIPVTSSIEVLIRAACSCSASRRCCCGPDSLPLLPRRVPGIGFISSILLSTALRSALRRSKSSGSKPAWNCLCLERGETKPPSVTRVTGTVACVVGGRSRISNGRFFAARSTSAAVALPGSTCISDR